MLRRWILCFFFALGVMASAGFDPAKDVAITLEHGAVVLQVPEGVHLKTAFMEIRLASGKGRLETGPMPAPTAKDELGDGIWRGQVRVPVRGQDLEGELALGVLYQPCTEGPASVCYPPTERILAVRASDLGGSAPSQSLVWLLLGAFGAGLLASLTPCVYPMIPITMAIVGARGGGKARGFLLSLSLVGGMAVTYTTLGVLAARSGAAFGAAAQHPAFLVPVALLFGAFALSLFGAFEIRLPARLQEWMQSGSRKGWLGAWTMGLVLGPLSAPCVGPVVGTILLAISVQGQVWLGALQLFVFSLGMGVLFVVAGTVTASLPRSGPWMIKLKQVMGLVALGFAFWTLRHLLPAWTGFASASLLLLLAAAVFGAFDRVEGLLASFAKGLGILALVLGLVLGIRAVESGLGLVVIPRPGSEAPRGQEAWKALWSEDYEGTLARAKAQQKRVVVDVWAEWCVACKELDDKTWPDPAVSAWIAEHAVAVRIDTDRNRKDLARSLQIAGYPTVLVLDENGQILRRAMGFQPPDAMLAFLKGE